MLFYMDGYSSNESLQWIFYVGYFLLKINATCRKKKITLLTLLLRPFCIFLFFHYHCIKLITHIIINFFLLDWTKSISSVKASFYKTAEVLFWKSPVFSSVLQWQYKFFIKTWITSNEALGHLFHSVIIHTGPLSQAVNYMLYNLKYRFLCCLFILPPFWQKRHWLLELSS